MAESSNSHNSEPSDSGAITRKSGIKLIHPVFPKSVEAKARKEKHDKICDMVGQSVDCGQKLIKGIQNKDSLAIIDSLLSFGGTIVPELKILGQIVSLCFTVFGLEGPQEETFQSIMMKELDKVHDKLEYLDRRLKDMESKIKDEFVLHRLKSRTDEVFIAEQSFNDWRKRPNEVTMKNFLKSCKRNSMEDVMAFLTMEMSSESETSFLSVISKDFNRFYLRSESAKVIMVFVRAFIIQLAAIRLDDLTKPNRQLELDEASLNCGKRLKTIIDSIETMDTRIEREFIGWAKSEVVIEMETHARMNNCDFSSHLFDYLCKKYYWRQWLVASYNGDTIEWAENTVWTTTTCQNGFHWFREHNRCVMVATPDPSKLNPEQEAIHKNCFHDFLRYHTFAGNLGLDSVLSTTCRHLHGELEKCMKLDGAFLACVHSGRDLNTKFSEGPGIFVRDIWVHSHKRGSVIITTFFPRATTVYERIAIGLGGCKRFTVIAVV